MEIFQITRMGRSSSRESHTKINMSWAAGVQGAPGGDICFLGKGKALSKNGRFCAEPNWVARTPAGHDMWVGVLAK